MTTRLSELSIAASLREMDARIQSLDVLIKELSDGHKKEVPVDFLAPLIAEHRAEHSAGKPGRAAAFNSKDWGEVLKKTHSSRASSLEKARIKARFLRGILGPEQPEVDRAAKTQCAGTARVDQLTEAQRVPGMLVFPGGLRRLIVDMSAGGGKSCIMLDVISNFLDADPRDFGDAPPGDAPPGDDSHKGYNIIVVGDNDVFLSIGDAIRNCPAKARYRSSPSRGGGDQDHGETMLRDINVYAGQGPEPDARKYCALSTKIAKEIMGPGLMNFAEVCARESLPVWSRAKFAFMDYARIDPWFQLYDDYMRKKQQGKNAKSVYGDIDPKGSNTIWIVDECHKLISSPDSDPRQQAAFTRIRENLKAMNAGYVVLLSATVNVTNDPLLSVQLPTVAWGKTNSDIYADGDTKKTLNVPDDARFLDPKHGFVTLQDHIDIYSPRPMTGGLPGGYKAQGAAPGFEYVRQKTSDVAALLRRHGCLEDGEDTSIYAAVDSPKVREAYAALFGNLYFVTENIRDYRFYPRVTDPYPLVRGVRAEAAHGAAIGSIVGRISAEASDNLRKARARVARKPNKENQQTLEEVERGAANNALPRRKNADPDFEAKWSERSLFVGCSILERLVDERLEGRMWTSDEVKQVEVLAPKWRAVADDIEAGVHLRGKGIVYSGARYRSSFDDSYYLLGLAFYLEHRLHYEIAPLAAMLGAAPDPSKPVLHIMADPITKFSERKTLKEAEAAVAKWRRGEVLSAQEARLALGGVRGDSYASFNGALALGGSTDSKRHDLCCLAEGGYKALNFRGVSFMCVLGTGSIGWQKQTFGRIRRFCSLAGVPDDHWTIQTWVYLLSTPGCMENFNCDCALWSWNEARGAMVEYLRQIEVAMGIGCRTWRHFSGWDKVWPRGWPGCILDGTLRDILEHRESSKAFYRCEDNNIVPSLAGDLSPVDVEASSSCRGTVPHRPTPPESRPLGGLESLVDRTQGLEANSMYKAPAAALRRFIGSESAAR